VVILHFLGSIDDVHNFGRTCRKTYDIVRRPEIYVEIMRSITEVPPSVDLTFSFAKC
jgi:hypothetical protein